MSKPHKTLQNRANNTKPYETEADQYAKESWPVRHGVQQHQVQAGEEKSSMSHHLSRDTWRTSSQQQLQHIKETEINTSQSRGKQAEKIDDERQTKWNKDKIDESAVHSSSLLTATVWGCWYYPTTGR